MTYHLSRYSRIFPRHTREFTLTYTHRSNIRTHNQNISVTCQSMVSQKQPCAFDQQRERLTETDRESNESERLTASEEVCRQADLMRGMSAFFMEGYSIRLAKVGIMFKHSSWGGHTNIWHSIADDLTAGVSIESHTAYSLEHSNGHWDHSNGKILSVLVKRIIESLWRFPCELYRVG